LLANVPFGNLPSFSSLSAFCAAQGQASSMMAAVNAGLPHLLIVISAAVTFELQK